VNGNHFDLERCWFGGDEVIDDEVTVKSFSPVTSSSVSESERVTGRVGRPNECDDV